MAVPLLELVQVSNIEAPRSSHVQDPRVVVQKSAFRVAAAALTVATGGSVVNSLPDGVLGARGSQIQKVVGMAYVLIVFIGFSTSIGLVGLSIMLPKVPNLVHFVQKLMWVVLLVVQMGLTLGVLSALLA